WLCPYRRRLDRGVLPGGNRRRIRGGLHRAVLGPGADRQCHRRRDPGRGTQSCPGHRGGGRWPVKRVAPGGPSRPGDGRRRLPWTFDATWAPLTASALMLVVGAVGLAADQPWLYPSLGPTAFMQAEYPGHRT